MALESAQLNRPLRPMARVTDPDGIAGTAHPTMAETIEKLRASEDEQQRRQANAKQATQAIAERDEHQAAPAQTPYVPQAHVSINEQALTRMLVDLERANNSHLNAIEHIQQRFASLKAEYEREMASAKQTRVRTAAVRAALRTLEDLRTAED